MGKSYSETEICGVTVLNARRPGVLPVYPNWHKKRGKRRADIALRDLAKVNAICVHHLGPHSGSDPVGDQSVQDRAVERALAQPYHTWVQPGLVVLVWDPHVCTWHGNSFNDRSMGLVVAGNFPSLESKRDPKIHQDQAIDYGHALRVAIQLLSIENPSIRYIVTHSQSAIKPADPGEIVARMLLHISQGMKTSLIISPDYTEGKGQPWPKEWRVPLEVSVQHG